MTDRFAEVIAVLRDADNGIPFRRYFDVLPSGQVVPNVQHPYYWGGDPKDWFERA